ncbi:MAG: response regulator transcription factor [Casimicrobium sp.]
MNAASLSSPIRVVVADDHPIVLVGLVALLSSDRGIRIVGQAEDGQQAVELIRQGGVDVLLLDLAMPGRAGLSLLRQLLDEGTDLRVIVFTAYDPASHKDRSLAIGASAYLAKGIAPQQIIETVHDVMLRPVPKRAAGGDDAPHNQLSPRQFDIFMRLVRGESVTHVAKDLHLSVKTVSTHKVTLQKRLGANSVVDLVRYSVNHHLVPANA